jgi:hypothetical protein
LTYHLLQGIHPDAFLDVPPKFIPTLLSNSSYANVTGGQRVEAISSGGRVSFYSAAKSVSHLITPVRCSTSRNREMSVCPLTASLEYSIYWRVINIIDRVLTPPLGLITTIVEADLTGTLAIIAGSDPDPRLLGALGETSDWTMYVFP